MTKVNGSGDKVEDKMEFAECAQCTCFNIRKAARVVTQLFDNNFRPLGIRGTQFTLLVHAMFYGPVTILKLADMLVMDRTTLARNLNPLLKMGLIKVNSGEDKRTRYITITGKGKEVLTDALPVWRDTQNMIKKELGKDNWVSMMSGINEIISRIEMS